ncbi:MAG: ferredoxin reductase [Mycobacterium sp.]
MTTTTSRPQTSGLRAALVKLAERVTTPLLPADYLDVIDPLLSGSQLRGRIVGIHPETRDAVTVEIKPGSGWRPHLPGQYLRLGIEVDGVRQWRSYSITSRPGDRCVTITVKAVSDGVVSNHLVRRATVGTIVHLEQPAGDFTLPRSNSPLKALFLTAGSGITPVMGMLRSLQLTEGSDIVVVHSAPRSDDVIFAGELRMLSQRNHIRLVEIHTGCDGRLEPTRLSDLVRDLDQRQTWACGPTDMLDAIERHWAAAGLSAQLHIERFRPTLVTTGEGGAVTFSATGTTVDDDGSRSLLDAGESAGVLMPSGCRMGICFGCVAPLRRGAVRDLRTGALTTANDGDGVVVQTCVSAAAGDCDIDL